MSTWQHLIRLGLYKDLLSTGIALAGAVATGWLPWRRHRKAQAQIADRLDTTTPGGLADLVPKPSSPKAKP